MYSVRDIRKGNETGDLSYIIVYNKLADVMREVSNSVRRNKAHAYFFDNELFYTKTVVSNTVWGILESFGYTVETFDNGDGVSGRGILVKWSY